jgi:hypothetical protein
MDAEPLKPSLRFPPPLSPYPGNRPQRPAGGITNSRSSALANPGGPVAGDTIALKLQGNGNLTSPPAGAAMSVINPTAGHVIGIPPIRGLWLFAHQIQEM